MHHVMNDVWFVVQCLLLFFLGGLVAVAGYMTRGESVKYMRSEATGAGNSGKPIPADYNRLESVFWSVLMRATAQTGRALVIVMFMVVLVWQWWLTAYHLSFGWQVAYLGLGMAALLMFTEFNDAHDDGIWMCMLAVGIGLALMLMHVAGLSDFYTPSFTVPSLHVHLP